MKRRKFLQLAIGTGCVACVAGMYPVCIERNLVQFTHYRIPIPNLPEAFVGLKVVHITDIHYGPLVSAKFVKKLLSHVNTLEKDVVVCTGDYVHERQNIQHIDRSP